MGNSSLTWWSWVPRKQAEKATRNKPISSNPSVVLHQFLLCSFAPIPASRLLPWCPWMMDYKLKQTLDFLNVFWPWCYITAIETIMKTVTIRIWILEYKLASTTQSISTYTWHLWYYSFFGQWGLLRWGTFLDLFKWPYSSNWIKY